MSNSNLTYLGSRNDDSVKKARPFDRLRLVPVPFLIFVVVPTLLVAIYYLLIASPMYSSESRFIVRSAERSQPSTMGLVLQGVGLSAAQGDAFAVQEYMTSRDATQELQRNGLSQILSRPGSDFLSRFPRPWEPTSNETLHKNFQRFLTVGYDSTTGISTVRVRAFRAEDAQAVNDALLHGGERLVNRLNERAAGNAVNDARRSVDEAQAGLSQAQARLTAFRNREGILDPQARARESSEVVAGLSSRLAELRAQRAQIAQEAPRSPQLPTLDNTITAFEAEIARERATMAGTAASLAPAVGAYEALRLDVELADKAVAAARTTFETTQQDARRQQLYLERVVNPNLPDRSSEPQRWRAILLVFLTTLILYGLGWLVVAGVREHKQS